MTPSEPEKPVGFVPRDQQAIAQAEKAAAAKPAEDSSVPAHYRKAFGARPIPTFKPKDE